jgi:hypothetical protein
MGVPSGPVRAQSGTFPAPKGRTVIAQGTALGLGIPKSPSPVGALSPFTAESRPFRAFREGTCTPRAMPWAISSCPVGAQTGTRPANPVHDIPIPWGSHDAPLGRSSCTFPAPKGRTVIAQGTALGLGIPKSPSPVGALSPFTGEPRLFRACRGDTCTPRATPWAISSCPVGAAIRDTTCKPGSRHGNALGISDSSTHAVSIPENP